ncbi:helix-turn-helix domain-containing protein [Xylophilus sp. Kf1]|nr:helix-turn-helix domain-containing protein [Xylophilus sp. Kf1]
MKAADWIDRLKTVKGWDSDYRVAKELGISRTTISNYRGRQSTLDEDMAVLIAELLGIELMEILLDQAGERAKSAKARKAFADAAMRLGGKVASILLLAGIAAAPQVSRASERVSGAPSSNYAATVYTSYKVQGRLKPVVRSVLPRTVMARIDRPGLV